MKKFLTSVLMGTMLFSSVAFASNVTERSDIDLVVNGTTIANENVPIIVNSRTLIPLRDLVTNLGVPDDNEHIIWNGEERTVTIKNDGVNIHLTIDSDVATVNGQTKLLDAPAMIYNSRTYIPARFVGEALNKKIGWDSYDSRVLVRDMEVYNEVKNSLTSSLEKMASAQKMKYEVNMDMGGTTTGSIMKMDMDFEMDTLNKEIYTNSMVDMMGMKMPVEQYWKDDTCYSKNQNGEWEVYLTDQSIEDALESAGSFSEVQIVDDTIFDILTIDYEKTTDKVLVLKNDITYDGLLQQVSDMQLQSAVTDGSLEDIANSIKDFTYEYKINRETKAIESMSIYMTMLDESIQEDLYVNMTISIEDVEPDFEVYCPLN